MLSPGFHRKSPCHRIIATLILLLLSVAACHAASIRGVVADASGAKVSGATVALISDGKVVSSTVSGTDGSFQIMTGSPGRFFLLVSAHSFRQLETPGFYAGRLDDLERNIVLEPEWVHESIVVTATGTPIPQSQTGAATSVLGPLDLDLRLDLVSALRLMPGTFVVQAGQMGAQTSLFVRGGASDANMILVDGTSAVGIDLADPVERDLRHAFPLVSGSLKNQTAPILRPLPRFTQPASPRASRCVADA